MSVNGASLREPVLAPLACTTTERLPKFSCCHSKRVISAVRTPAKPPDGDDRKQVFRSMLQQGRHFLGGKNLQSRDLLLLFLDGGEFIPVLGQVLLVPAQATNVLTAFN